MEESSSVNQVASTGSVSDENTEINTYAQLNSSKNISSENQSSNLEDPDGNMSSDDEDGVPVMRIRKKVQQFSESDSDEEQSKNNDRGSDNGMSSKKSALQSESDDSDSPTIFINKSKSRIQKVTTNSSDSDTSIQETSEKPIKNVEQQMRMKNKRNKFLQKFKNLKTARGKDKDQLSDDNEKDNSGAVKSDSDSENSNDEASSIDKIKQKIKERNLSLKMSICDPDTSDEEGSQQKEVVKKKRPPKSTKLTSPKPMRMTAKQAMENMQKIKSESNRMLREKEVSLPYHRPKALTLKDIMSRRKPAVSSDGKVLPIKMNEEQLKQYAMMLEQRQKEMMELCKSESEEESENETKLENTVKADNIAEKNCENETTIEKQIDEVDSAIDEEHKELNKESESISELDEERKKQSNEYEAVPKVNEDSDNVAANVNNSISNTEMELVYNDSVEEVVNNVEDTQNGNTEKETNENTDNNISNDNAGHTDNNTLKAGTETDSQLISLQYENTEKCAGNTENLEEMKMIVDNSENNDSVEAKNSEEDKDDFDNFSDNDINMEDIDSIIENAEIMKDGGSGVDSPMLIRDPHPLNVKPKLTGAPGMVIDLDGSNSIAPKKLSGVELLKERFTYFAKLKTPEEEERMRQNRIKPGTQHLKLKQELEEKMAEQRSLEWAKRLEEEKQQQKELDAIRGDESDADDIDDIDKIEAKLADVEEVVEKDSSESEEEEEELENDVEIKDKPRKRNPMLADEAEESDCDDEGEDNVGENDAEDETEVNGDEEGENSDNDKEDEESSEEESSESEEEQETKPKKGRILKAFEDSDDEENIKEIEPISNNVAVENVEKMDVAEETTARKINDDNNVANSSPEVNSNVKDNEDNAAKSSALSQDFPKSQEIKDTQDDELQLAQLHKSFSEDLFTSQESGRTSNSTQKEDGKNNISDDKDLGTQTFSILESMDTEKEKTSELDLKCPDNLPIICETQPYDEGNFDAIVGMCSGSFSQNLVTTQPEPVMSQSQVTSQSQIGEDVLALCTGKFYDNQFVSQENNKNTESKIPNEKTEEKVNDNQKAEDKNLLNSILDELNDPEFDAPKPNKYFANATQNKENERNIVNTQLKKKFIIDSEDESNEATGANEQKKKKLKKKKPEKRALQISDDEEEEDYSEEEAAEDNASEVEDNEERMVEYDSEENEVVVKPQEKSKKKRKVADFFEQEAELTSEDEWAGSDDENEAGLDRMEREAGDDETFHQGKLQRELGQIHMRDVLDQDKREVRLLQELLFEDGDLGGGQRQRKFRWRNADGEEETGTVPDEFADTQEEEYESEEQWRKQRHEREVFLRQLQQQEETEDLNVSVNRTAIIKANLTSRTMSSLLMEANTSATETTNTELPVLVEKKSSKDIPSPKKPFSILQQNYHGSFLSRGRSTLARLAALATPLAGDDDAPKVGSLAPSSKRNFVFASITRDEEEEPKVTKRKAESNAGTPKLVKKMKMEEKQKYSRNSLLDHIKT